MTDSNSMDPKENKPDFADTLKTDEQINLSKYALDNSSVATFVIELSGNIEYANKKACSSLGYSYS